MISSAPGKSALSLSYKPESKRGMNHRRLFEPLSPGEGNLPEEVNSRGM